MISFKTEQEGFWAGDFGDEYTSRNKTEIYLASNISFFAEILKKTRDIKSIIEFGSNIGINLLAVNKLLPDVELSAIELNKNAVEELRQNIPKIRNIYNQSILDFEPPLIHNLRYDLVLVKGVLIHINPERLNAVYEKIYLS